MRERTAGTVWAAGGLCMAWVSGYAAAEAARRLSARSGDGGEALAALGAGLYALVMLAVGLRMIRGRGE